MDWYLTIGVVLAVWTVLTVLSGERLDQSQRLAALANAVAEQQKAGQKKRAVQAAVAAVSKMETAAK